MSLAVGNHEGNRTGALGALITMAAFGTHPERARTALQRCKNQVLRQPYRAFDDFRKRPARRIETTAVPANRAPIVRQRLDAAHGGLRGIVHQDRTLTSGSGARQFERRSYAVNHETFAASRTQPAGLHRERHGECSSGGDGLVLGSRRACTDRVADHEIGAAVARIAAGDRPRYVPCVRSAAG